jgi:hypothetical protein
MENYKRRFYNIKEHYEIEKELADSLRNSSLKKEKTYTLVFMKNYFR